MKRLEWKISQFDTPQQSPGFLLWQLSMEWRRSIERSLTALNLTHPQFVILASTGWLTREGDQINQIELAKQCKMDITMTSQILRTLEKKELIERYRIEGNEKTKLVKITQKGRDLIEQAIPLVETVDQEYFCINSDRFVKLIKLIKNK